MLGSLSELSASAGNCRGELLEILAVHVFLLAVDFFYGSSTEEQRGNRVSCDNIGALYTFAKKSKRVPVSSSNTDLKRAL